MNYNFLSFLISWIFPTKSDRAIFRDLCNAIENRKSTNAVQNRYNLIIKKLKNLNKFNVIFLVNDISKWKYQSLFDEMKKSENYKPLIVLTISDIQKGLNVDEKKKILENNLKFFQDKDMNAVIKYDTKSDRAISLKNLNPDIVFYQQPYDLPKIQAPREVSKCAITCYVPYYLPDYRNFQLDCEYDFHHKLFRFYVLNDELKNEYKNHLDKINEFSGNFKSVGHTMLDLFINKKHTDNMGYVIYAPHWSINQKGNENNINISTFDKNGIQILDFAKQHTEIKWVFKPHPTLKTALTKIGWTDEQINHYYNEWESIALTSYNSDYADLFLSSKAMITDSGSFLLEYFVTGKPLIHLIPKIATHQPYSQLQKYFQTFYQANNYNELESYLNEIILKNNDYKKSIRSELLKNAKFLQENAAKNIIKDLNNTLEVISE